LHANLPVAYALWETQKIWPPADANRLSDEFKEHDAIDKELTNSIEALDIGEEQADEFEYSGSDLEPSTKGREVHIDTLVSIGTGEQKRVDSYPSAFEIGGLKQAYLSFIKAMDTEASWEEFKRNGPYNERRHHRLNVPITGKYVAIDDWDQMHRLEKAVHEIYRTSDHMLNAVQDVASRLAASLLFFEPDAPDSGRLQPPDRWHRIHGQIWCRLPRDSAALVALTDRISGFWFKEDNPKMTLPGRVIPVMLKDGWKSEIRTEGKHFSLPITIKTMEPDSTVLLAVRLKDVSTFESASGNHPKERTNPISGFPIVFKDLETMASAQ
jgi:hypothetical protein